MSIEFSKITTMTTDDARFKFSERLHLALDTNNIPPKGSGRYSVVAKMFHVSQKGARKWLEGEAIPTTKRIQGMSERLNVRGEWLLTGRGPMLITDTEEPTARVQSELDSASPKIRGLIHRMLLRIKIHPSDERRFEMVMSAFVDERDANVIHGAVDVDVPRTTGRTKTGGRKIGRSKTKETGGKDVI